MKNQNYSLPEERTLTHGFLSSTVMQMVLILLWLPGLQLQAQVSELWGMTENTIFKTDVDGTNLQVMHKLRALAYNDPTFMEGSLLYTGNGKFYGMSTDGGEFQWGALFEYDQVLDSLMIRYSFHENQSGGDSPSGSLIEATDGKLYGMTPGDGHWGWIFSFEPSSGIVMGTNFNWNNGANPTGSLIQASNGKLYGMTQTGGSEWLGTLVEYDITTRNIVPKVHFDSAAAHPRGTLMQASNGKLYGMTSWGGFKDSTFIGKGVLFGYTIGHFGVNVLHVFDGPTGSGPVGAVIQASNGKLYGMAGGGANGHGVIFEYDISADTLIVRHDFDGVNTGSGGTGTLMEASNGKLYGMTRGGGVYGLGVLFEFDPATGTVIKRQDFDGTNGQKPLYTHLIEVITCTPTTSIINPEVCYRYISPSGKYNWAVSGTYMDTVMNAFGCDSVITINLTIRDSVTCDMERLILSAASDSSWMKSTVVTPTNLSGMWNGVNGTLPDLATFTEAAMVGQPYPWEHINPVPASDPIKTGHSITYFRNVFSLADNTDIEARIRMTVDDQAEVYINGNLLTRIEGIGPVNYKNPPHDVLFHGSGIVNNGYMGGDPYAYTSAMDMSSVFQAGINEIIVVVRNLGKTIDKGGFSFRMDLSEGILPLVPKSAESGQTNEGSGLSVYPNPVTAGLTVELSTPVRAGIIRLYDLNGKLLIEKNIWGNLHLDLSSYSSGIYLLKVVSGSETFTQKVVKE